MRIRTFITYLIFTSVLGMVFSSCASTPNFDRATTELPKDISSYCDYIIRDCIFPDGKKVTAYVFNNADDLQRMQGIQERKYNPKFKAWRTEWGNMFGYSPDLMWEPIGPVTPFMKALSTIYDKYGEKKSIEIQKNNILATSYYRLEDLGELSLYMTSINSGAQACYENSKGVYLLTIARIKYLHPDLYSRKDRKLHKNELAYQIGFIPKELYTDQPIKLQPAKTQPYKPSVIPDSDRNLNPVLPKNNSIYYYNEILAYQLQWLAVKIACKGVYDMAYTGDFRAKNPTDYYKTSFIKSYLARNNGQSSKGTILFEGICFDYADFAYQELSNNKSEYQNISGFWMVSTFQDSSDIITYRLANRGENPTMTINGTPIVVNSHQRIQAHDNAKNHAWFWVQATDGVVYWVDPTWTDNTGRPVFGIVRGSQEIQLSPSADLCIK